MIAQPIAPGGQPTPWRAWPWVLAAAALLAGLYGRFRGIGIWPLGVDEFYISRSVDNILRSGLPAFPCGGYYTRGLIFQYVIAGLRLCGWSPEFAGRFVAGICSLALLPAAYLLGKRVQGTLAGWLLVIILCLSVWEIEMARFARMYAPFQALFAWYVLAYVRFTVDRQAAALRWMIALSVLGVLVWEGGVLLGVANLFAVLASSDEGRLRRKDCGRLVLLGVLLVLLVLATRDLRGFADPPGAQAGAIEEPATPLHLAASWFAPLGLHPGWAAGLLLPLALAIPALRWIGGFRGRWLAAGGLGAVLCAAAAHAILAACGMLILLLLLCLVKWHELTWRRARYFWLATGAFALFWLAVTAAPGAPAAMDPGNIIRQLFGFPDIYDHVLKPWLRTVPILSSGLFAAFAFLTWRSITAMRERADSVGMLLSLVIVLVLAVGATPTDRIETRYTFFLYPLLLLLAVCALLMMGEVPRLRRARPLIAVLPLLCFGATEDFQPRHILDVDSAAINFRVGMPAHRAEHYYPKNDIRGVGQWLAAEVRPGDVVITGIPSLDQYYGHIDYFFLDEGDDRYETYVCPDGLTERWTNRPVLYTLAALKPLLASGHRVFASLFSDAERRLKSAAPAAGWSVTRVWTADSRTADVDLILAQPDAAHAP